MIYVALYITIFRYSRSLSTPPVSLTHPTLRHTHSDIHTVCPHPQSASHIQHSHTHSNIHAICTQPQSVSHQNTPTNTFSYSRSLSTPPVSLTNQHTHTHSYNHAVCPHPRSVTHPKHSHTHIRIITQSVQTPGHSHTHNTPIHTFRYSRRPSTTPARLTPTTLPYAHSDIHAV